MAISDRINEMYTHVGDVYDTITNVDVNTGKNLISNIDIYNGYPTGNNGGTIGYNSSVNSITYKKCAYVVAGQSYTLSWKINTIKAVGSRDIKIVDNNNIILANFSYSNANNNRTRTFTPNQSGWVYASLDANATEVQLELGSQATDYQPYTDTPTYKNIENIPKVIRNSYLEIMNNGIDKIWNNWEKVTGEGETITLNSTEEAPMKIDLKGNTSQETTTGKNSLPRLVKGTTEFNGKTYSVDDDGVLTMSGTPSLAGPVNIQFQTPYQITSETRYIYLLNDYKDGTFGVRIMNGNTRIFEIIPNPENKIVDLSQYSGQTITNIQIYQNLSFTATRKIYLMICTNNSQTTYEPYTNGASPNPNYPQDIHVVSGDNSIDICGKNLYNGTYTPKKYIHKNTGNIANSGDWSATDYISIAPNTTYIYSGITNGWSGSAGTCFYDSEKHFISSIASNVYTFTTPANARYVRMSLNSETPGNIQLEKGSTASTHEPYQEQNYSVNLGVENIWKNQLSGFLPQSGSYPTTSSSYPNARYVLINLLAGQSITLSGSTSNFGRVRYIDKDTNQVVGMVDSGETAYYKSTSPFVAGFTEGTITAKKEVIIGIMDMGGAVNNLVVNYGTTPQYISDTPIELCKIGDYQDKIAKSTGKNLFDKDSVVGGFVNADGSVGGDTNAYRTSDFIPIQPNTAYYKTSTESPRTKYYDSNKQPLNTTTYQDILIGGNAGTFTTPNNAYYLRFSYPVSSVNANSIMINEGTTALPYEPYGKVWYLNKQIGKVVLNGSWPWGTQRTTNYQCALVNANKLYLARSGIGLSNYFRIGTSGTDIFLYPILQAEIDYIRISNATIKWATLDNFKAFITNNSAVFYYPLATPTYTEITDSTLISQLEALNGARSYTTQTNINQVNNDLPFILDVMALKQLN